MPSSKDSRTSAAADRLHPKLWDKVRKRWLEGDKAGVKGKWNARKAQLAVLEYKRLSLKHHGDDGYRTKAPSRENSLQKWTREDWGYAGLPGKSRYLPRKVRESLTKTERRRENKAKRGRKGEKVPYSKSVLEKMRGAGVLRPEKSHTRK